MNAKEPWHRFQSAYRACQSTETALLRVPKDLAASDDGQVSLLTLLELSAASDTTDLDSLLHRLEHVSGIHKSALSFFRTYPTERKHTVSISGYGSNPSELLHVVPRGSVLGPILFLLYTQPFSQISDRHSVFHGEFADDSQLYDLVSREHLDSLLANMR